MSAAGRARSPPSRFGDLGADSVAAVDPSAPFVAAAAARNPGVDVSLAAEALPYADGSFDRPRSPSLWSTSWPIRRRRDPRDGRVTRPGRGCCRPSGTSAANVARSGRSEPPHGLDADVTDESKLAGARRGHLAELLEAAGLRDIADGELRVERAFDSFDAWWQPFTFGGRTGRALVARLDQERRTELRERCRSRLPGGPFVLTAVAWAARGVVRPAA